MACQVDMTESLCAGQVSKMKEEVPLPLPPSNHPPALVLGGDEDVIVDRQALEESGEVYGVQPVILQNAAHDIMLVGPRPNHCHGCDFWTRRSRCENLFLITAPNACCGVGLHSGLLLGILHSQERLSRSDAMTQSASLTSMLKCRTQGGERLQTL